VASEAEPASTSRTKYLLLLLAGAAAIALGLWWMGGSGAGPQDYPHRTGPFLGVEGEMHLVMPAARKEQARQALRQAEEALRDAEARLSAAREDSEVHRLNMAKAGEAVPLSPPALEALRTARRLHADTRGAFDVTLPPLAAVWRQAAQDQRVPAPTELAAARAASAWNQFELLEDGAVKGSDSAGVDLGGLARALAVDRAAETLAGLGGQGGAVILGGSLRCFGRRADGSAWNIDVPDPFAVRESKTLMTLAVADAAVATVAPYRLYETIGGRSYGRVLNPATGWPAGGAASATVVAPTCAQAEAWAVALCTLGESGLRALPAGVEALVVTGTPQAHRVHVSDGFARYRAAPQQHR
jgi:thiamine biosynthesis lipoprotein